MDRTAAIHVTLQPGEPRSYRSAGRRRLLEAETSSLGRDREQETWLPLNGETLYARALRGIT